MQQLPIDKACGWYDFDTIWDRPNVISSNDFVIAHLCPGAGAQWLFLSFSFFYDFSVLRRRPLKQQPDKTDF